MRTMISRMKNELGCLWIGVLTMLVLVGAAVGGAVGGAFGQTVTVAMDVAGIGEYMAAFDVSKNGRQWKQFVFDANHDGDVSDAGEQIAGVHLYVGRYRTGNVRIDMRVSNASVNVDGTGFCGTIYFRSLRVYAYQPVHANLRYGESIDGNVYTIAKNIDNFEGGAVNVTHVLPTHFQLQRAFIIGPAERDREILGMFNRSELVLPKVISGYGPLRSTLPKIDRAAVDARFRKYTLALRKALLDGTPLYIQDYVNLQVLDCHVLEGEDGADAVGGYGIELSQAECQTPWTLVFREEMSRASAEARPFACYNAKTGEPIKAHEWTNVGLTHRQNVYVGGGEVHELPAYLAGSYNSGFYQPVFNPGFYAPSDERLTKRRSIDGSHLVRQMRNPMPVAEILGLQPQRDDIDAAFEANRSDGWSNRIDEQLFKAPGEGYLHPSLAGKLYGVKLNPHVGGWFERTLGWHMFFLAEELRLHPGRADMLKDARDCIALTETAADQFGFTANGWLGASEYYLPIPWSGPQIFHQGLVDNGEAALCWEYRGEVNGDVLNRLERSFTSQYESLVVRSCGNGVTAPPKWLGLTKWKRVLVDDPDRPGQGIKIEIWGDPEYVTSLSQSYMSEECCPCPGYPLHLGATLYRVTGKKKYLDVPLKYWHPHATQTDRAVWLAAQEYPSWTGESLYVVQKYLASQPVPK